MSGKTWLDEVPDKLSKMPLTHKAPELVPLSLPVLGVVMHTTNPGSRIGPQTLERFRADFEKSGPPPLEKFRSAHFMVDRDGRIAQFRSLVQGSAHIGSPWMPRYLGIEHIAFHRDPLTDAQIDASADLLSLLKSEFDFPLSELSAPGSSGVGRHNQFNSTGCGEGPFFSDGSFGPDFKKILARALERSPVGSWDVKIGVWTWTYIFKAGVDFASGSAEWRGASQSGTGTWTLDTKIQIAWDNGTLEAWDTPLNSNGQRGTVVRQGRENRNLTDDERKVRAQRTD